jgi:hypothetical protein
MTTRSEGGSNHNTSVPFGFQDKRGSDITKVRMQLALATKPESEFMKLEGVILDLT